MEGVEDKGGDVAGYMPLQRQVGFIYDNPNLFVVAHELGHGAFNLRHTFSLESFIAAERTTQNLMDYAGGTELWAHQWGQIRDPQNIWFAWAQEEGEGEWLNQYLTEEQTLGIVNQIRISNIEEINRLNLNSFIFSRGTFSNSFKIGEKYFSNFEIEIKGVNDVIQPNSNQLNEIDPAEYNRIYISQTGENHGNFIKYQFHSFKKTPEAPFSEQLSNNILLEITVKDDDSWAFEHYLYNITPNIEIVISNIESDSLYTLSSLDIDNGKITGYMIERPSGTAEEERTEGSLKRIPSGTYSVCFPYGDCRPETTRPNRLNELWVKTHGEYDQLGGYISRNYILVHVGNKVWDTEGCILPGTGHHEFTLKENYENSSTGELYTAGTTMEMVTGSTDFLNNTLSPYLMDKINVLKVLGLDRSIPEYLGIKIIVNR